MPLVVTLLETAPPAKYQVIAAKAVHLKQLGLSVAGIGRALGVTGKTAAKAIAWFRETHRAEGYKDPPS